MFRYLSVSLFLYDSDRYIYREIYIAIDIYTHLFVPSSGSSGIRCCSCRRKVNPPDVTTKPTAAGIQTAPLTSTHTHTRYLLSNKIYKRNGDLTWMRCRGSTCMGSMSSSMCMCPVPSPPSLHSCPWGGGTFTASALPAPPPRSRRHR